MLMFFGFLGFVSLLDIVALLYIFPKCRENGTSTHWMPFSFHYKLFMVFVVVMLISLDKPWGFSAIFTVLYVFNFSSILRGWHWEQENPFTVTKMDIINIKEGKFSPVSAWKYDYMLDALQLFTARYIFDVYFSTVALLSLFDPHCVLPNFFIK